MVYNGQALQDKYVLNVLNNKKTDILLRFVHMTRSEPPIWGPDSVIE